MSEAKIGRVVAAALHQALADTLPLRLDYYEGWLRPWHLREGRVTQASFNAVLSFLRLEGDAWEPVMALAGRYAADWTFESLSGVRRLTLPRLPARLRLRAVLRLTARLVSETAPQSRATMALAIGGGQLDIGNSAFCDVRQPAVGPLCGFYVSALARFCELVSLDARVSPEACRAMGEPRCLVVASVLQPAERPMGVAAMSR